MSPRGRRILWALILAGLVARVAPAFATVGIAYDIQSYQLVADRLHDAHPFALYAYVNPASGARWPYPSGYFPWLLAADWVAKHTALPFHGVVQLPPILADAALAWVVQAFLGDRGFPERTRLIAAGLVALGPSFAFVSGYEGQLDSAAILPAAAALLVWGRMSSPGRALPAGALIGLGAALKTVPALVVLALLPSATSRREIAVLLGAVAAVPIVLLAPWLIAEPHATVDSLRYTGVPGLGGLSLLAQPNLVDNWLTAGGVQLTGLSSTLLDLRFPITAGAVAAATAFLLWRRAEPAAGAVLLWVTVLASALNFGPRYVVWGLPFILMAGKVREAALLQLVAFPAAVILAFRTYHSEWVAVVYVGLMLALLAGLVAWLILLVFRMRRPGAASQPA
jgi:uncharacterized membrane protein